MDYRPKLSNLQTFKPTRRKLPLPKAQKENMFKQRKSRGFNLKGRYFDEDKERRDNVLRKKDEKIPFEDKEKYRERLRQNWEYRRTTGSSKNFGKRIIVIFGILVALLYALFYLL